MGIKNGGEAQSGDQAEALPAPGADGPGSETERFQAIHDLRHNEAVTGESGVPQHKRDHELRCQQSSLAEFS